MNLKTIDLCAGIGGIRRGFELAGDYRNIASAEIDEMACKTYLESQGALYFYRCTLYLEILCTDYSLPPAGTTRFGFQ